MRALITTTLLTAAGLCGAQTATPSPAAPASNEATRVETRTERIVVEDSSARIDELRIGGETRSITVLPRGGMPAYQVEPTRGERSWKVLSF